MEEKTYHFTKLHSEGGGTSFEVNESELTAAQKDYLLGELISRFNNLPKELQHKFIKQFLEDAQPEHTDSDFDKKVISHFKDW